jgi:hypothetical protein
MNEWMGGWLKLGGRSLQSQCWIMMRGVVVAQGEERDSSDEEWAQDYATMDAISQLGWRNRRAGVEGPAEQLMRDVLEVGDVVHLDAMAEMVASRNIDENCSLNAEVNIGGSTSRHEGGSRSPFASVEVDQSGECK